MALWTPSQLTGSNTPKAWIHPLDASTITSDVGAKILTDKSGNGFSPTQVTTTKQPSIISGGLNGMTTIRFDGTDDFMSSTSNFPITGDAAFSVFALYKKKTVSKGMLFGWGVSAGSLTGFGLLDDNGTYICYAFASINNYYISAVANDTWTLMTYIKSPGAINTTSISRKNGVANGTSGHSTGTPNIGSKPLSLGIWADYFATNFYGNVELAELIILPYAADSSTMEIIEGYMAWEVALASALLTATHPYYSAAPTIALPTGVCTSVGGIILGGVSLLDIIINITLNSFGGIILSGNSTLKADWIRFVLDNVKITPQDTKYTATQKISKFIASSIDPKYKSTSIDPKFIAKVSNEY